MRHGPIVIAAAAAFLIAAGASAQVSYGVAKTPGVTFQPAPAAPTPPPAVRSPNPPRAHGRAGRPHSGGDLFLAGPHTYSPRGGRRSRLFKSPYVVSIPYFYPFDYPLGLDSTVSIEPPYSERAVIDAGYLVLRTEPRTAMVYIDGFFVGSADEIGPPGYRLEPGPHRVELEAEGFETVTFDVRVLANETITYAKDLERPAPATPAPAPVVVTQPATPKTLYVIPRCYAGDRRPDQSELPEQCRLADLRIIR